MCNCKGKEETKGYSIVNIIYSHLDPQGTSMHLDENITLGHQWRAARLKPQYCRFYFAALVQPGSETKWEVGITRVG